MQDSSKTTARQSLTVRLPIALAEKLESVAAEHGVTRTDVLVSLLADGLDSWTPARHPQDGARQTSNDGAIEVLRLELDELRDRVERLERSERRSGNRGAVKDKCKTAQDDLKTTKEVAAIEGWRPGNVPRNAKRSGRWVSVKRGVWRPQV